MVAKLLVDYDIRNSEINKKYIPIPFRPPPKKNHGCLGKRVCSSEEANLGMPLGFICDPVLFIILISLRWWQVLLERRLCRFLPIHLHCSGSSQGHEWQHCHGSENSLLRCKMLLHSDLHIHTPPVAA